MQFVAARNVAGKIALCVQAFREGVVHKFIHKGVGF